MSVLSITLTLTATLATFAYSQPEKYLDFHSRILSKIALTIMMTLAVYGLSLEFFIFKAKEAGLGEDVLNSITSQMWSVDVCGQLFLSVAVAIYIPMFIASFTKRKEK